MLPWYAIALIILGVIGMYAMLDGLVNYVRSRDYEMQRGKEIERAVIHDHNEGR